MSIKSKKENLLMLLTTVIFSAPIIFGIWFGFDFGTSEINGVSIILTVRFYLNLLVFGNLAVLLYAFFTRKKKNNIIGITAIVLSTILLLLRVALYIWGYLAFGVY